MVIFLSLLVALVGVLMYALCAPSNGKLIEIGRIMFMCGLLAFLLQVTPQVLTLVK